jgi:hypothetical protein
LRIGLEVERRYATVTLCCENRGLKPHGYIRSSLRETNCCSQSHAEIQLHRYG